MKKGWRTAAACVVIYILSFGGAAAVLRPERETGEITGETEVTVEKTASERAYTVREHNGVVAVFTDNGEAPVFETDIPIDGLRQTDRQLLANGINLASYREVLSVLEDFGS